MKPLTIKLFVLLFTLIFTFPGSQFSGQKKKVNDQYFIEKYCKENNIKIKRDEWSFEARGHVPLKMYDKEGYLIHLDLSDNQGYRFPKSLNNLTLNGNRNLKPLDLRHLSQLESISLGLCNIKDLKNYHFPKSIKTISLAGNKNIKPFDLRHLKNLQEINLTFCNIKDLKAFKLPTSLTALGLLLNKDLLHIDLSPFPKLEHLLFFESNVQDLKDIKLPKSIKTIWLERSKNLKRVKLVNYPKLEKLKLSNCQIKDLVLSKLPKLKLIHLRGNKPLEKARLINFPNLEALDLSACNFATLSLKKLPKLTKLDVKENRRLLVIDVSQVPNIKTLKYTIDDCKLKTVLLHPKNTIHKGVAKITYERDNKNRLLSIEYFNQKGQYVNDPKDGVAKITYQYEDGIPKKSGRYDALSLNKFKLKGVTFKAITKKLYPSQTNRKKLPVLGLVTIMNPSKEKLYLKLELSSPEFKAFYNKSKTTIATKIVVQPKSKKTLRVYLPFRDKIWENKRDQLINVTLTVTARTKSGRKSEPYKKTFNFTLMAMNKIDWKDIRNIAPFGSPEDPIIAAMAREIEKMNAIKKSQMPPKLYRMMVAYELLRTLNLNYSSMHRGSEDLVKTPSQIYAEKTGKCTDTAILYGSLLARLGYSTIITTFNHKLGNETISHIMLLIDTTLSKEDWRFLHRNKDKLVSLGPDSKRLYIPIETTDITSGMTGGTKYFLKAWSHGLGQFEKHRDAILNPKNTFRLDSAWLKSFKPMTTKDKEKFTINPPDRNKLKRTIEDLQDIYILKHLNAPEEYDRLIQDLDNTNYKTFYDLGMYLFKTRRYGEARSNFLNAARLAPNKPFPHYYYSAVLAYIALSNNNHIDLMQQSSALRDLRRGLNRLSRILMDGKGGLSLSDRWALNHDASKWFNALGDKKKGKVHEDLSQQAQKKMDSQREILYSKDIVEKLKAEGLKPPTITKLQANKVSYKTAFHLLKDGFNDSLISGLLSKGYRDSILSRLTMKKLTKGKVTQHIDLMKRLNYIHTVSDMEIIEANEIKGFREDTVIAIGVKGFSEEDILALAAKGFSEEDEVSLITKGFSEEDSIASATKGFSEEDALASGTKGYSEEIWSVTK